jgi:hypothetical protein
MSFVKNESVDLVMSNETLCELNRDGLELALRALMRKIAPEISTKSLSPGEILQQLIPLDYAEKAASSGSFL